MTNVKVVPKTVTPEMEAAFTRVMDGPCPDTPTEAVQLLFDAMLAASPASDYVAVTKDDAKLIVRYLRKESARATIRGTVDGAARIADRLTNALKEAE